MDLGIASLTLTSQAIQIEWKDGHKSIYSHRFLRLRCPCAHCVDEWTHEVRLDPLTVPQDVQAVDYMFIGNYGVELLWSDTHYTGIYTYQMLRASCSCLDCLEKT